MSVTSILILVLVALIVGARRRVPGQVTRVRNAFKRLHLAAPAPVVEPEPTTGRWRQAAARGPMLALAIVASQTDLALEIQRASPAVMLFALVLLAIYWQRTADLGWTLARRIAIPRGWPRMAYHLTKFSANRWREDLPGGAVLAAAWAVYARPKHDPTAATWVENKLHALPQLAGAGVVAQGLLSASRGDTQQAKMLMQSVATLVDDDTPEAAVVIAGDWLFAYACALGEWNEVLRLGNSKMPLSPQTKFLMAVGQRLQARPSPPDITLKARWLRAGKLLHTRFWLDQALARHRVLYERRDKARQDPSTDDPAPTGTHLQQALALHARVLAEGPVYLRLHPHKLEQLLDAWEAVFAGNNLVKHLQRRVLSLEAAVTPTLAVARYRQQVCEQVAGFADAAELPLTQVDLGETPSIHADAARVLRNRLLVTVEQMCDSLHNRVRSGRNKLAIDEWREWMQLRKASERASTLGGMDARRVLFPQIHSACCAHGVWLWNERKEYALAMPVFRWLLQEAEAVGDEAAIELQRKNAEVKH